MPHAFAGYKNVTRKHDTRDSRDTRDMREIREGSEIKISNE
jgi:hypothetical protein